MRRTGLAFFVLAFAGPAVAQPLPQSSGPPEVRNAPVRAVIPPARVEGSCAAVPMDLGAIIPVVEVMVGDRGPYRFAIDTGAQGHGRIAAALAQELGLQVVGEARTPAPGGAVATRSIYGAGSLTLGGVTFRDVNLLEASPVRGPNMPWDGILGIDLFQDLTLTLDYANGVAAVRPESLNGGVPAIFDIGIPSIPIEIAGRTFQVDLDTGNAAGPLFLPEAEARSLPLGGEPVERGRARTSFGDFAIMEAPLAAPVTVGGFVLPVRTVGWPPARGSGNLGSRGLAGTVLQVDRRSGQIAVSAPASAPACPA